MVMGIYRQVYSQQYLCEQILNQEHVITSFLKFSSLKDM